MRCPTLNDLPPAPAGKTGWPWTAESTQLPELTPDGLPWPRLSIVTPSYNQGQYLEATIRSVLLQGYPDVEYILIDGGSHDGSLDIIDKYKPWFAYSVSEPDGGQYAALNTGFAASTGDVMSWLNSDDMYILNSFWAVGSIFASLGRKVRWLTGTPAVWDRDGNLGQILERPKPHRMLLRRGWFDGASVNFIQQEGTFWSRGLWERSGGYLDCSLAFAADFELWCRMARYAELYVATTPFAGFRMHDHQKTTDAFDAYQRDIAACHRALWVGPVERHRVTRAVERRLVQLWLRTRRAHNLVYYQTREMRWAM